MVKERGNELDRKHETRISTWEKQHGQMLRQCGIEAVEAVSVSSGRLI